MRRLLVLAAALPLACTDLPIKPPLDVGERLAPGVARAGVVTAADQLVGGPATQGKVGDLKIYNSRVAFIIEAAGLSDGYNTLGGMPIAADLVRAPGEPGESLLGEIFIGVGGRLANLSTLEVVNDGQNGEPAVIRAMGPDVPILILEAFTGLTFPTIGATYAYEYSLGPDDDALAITVNVVPAEQLASTVYTGFVFGDGLRNMTLGEGFNVARQALAAPFMGAVGEKVSYAFIEKNRDFTPVFPYSGMLFGTFGQGTAGAGGLLRLEFLLAVGGGDLTPLLARHAAARGATLVPISGRIVDNAGNGPIGGRVHVETELDDYAGFIRTRIDGTFTSALPAGRYRLSAVGEGQLPTGSVLADLTTGAKTGLTLSVTGGGNLELTATEGGQPSPAKFVVQPVDPSPALPDTWGENRLSFGADRIEFAGSGTTTVRLAPGVYKVTASRGFEYDRVVGNVTVPAGGRATFTAALTRVVDTGNWLSADFHIHSQRSPDSNDAFALKVNSFAAEGLEVPVSTEHDYIADLAPTARALGLDKYMHIVIGTEMSTTIGHINAFPLVPQAGKINAGAPSWFGKTMPAMFALLRENPGNPVLQVNHPLSMSGGLWASVNLTLAGLPAVATDSNWTEAYDVAEVFNGGGVTNTAQNVMPLWFALLNRGKRVGATGNSDSHSSKSSSVGHSRTFVVSNTDNPALVDEGALMTSVRSMAMTVSGGPFVTLVIAAQKPGSVVSVPTGAVDLGVKVQAPLWMGPMKKLEVIANGAVIAAVDAAHAFWHNDQVVRFDETIAHTPTRDTWYLVRVWGDTGDPMAPVADGQPFSFTNPVYVDRDGGGFAPVTE